LHVKLSHCDTRPRRLARTAQPVSMLVVRTTVPLNVAWRRLGLYWTLVLLFPSATREIGHSRTKDGASQGSKSSPTSPGSESFAGDISTELACNYERYTGGGAGGGARARAAA